MNYINDGEEPMAASEIIDAVDSLDDGQYLVIWKEVF